MGETLLNCAPASRVCPEIWVLVWQSPDAVCWSIVWERSVVQNWSLPWNSQLHLCWGGIRLGTGSRPRHEGPSNLHFRFWKKLKLVRLYLTIFFGALYHFAGRMESAYSQKQILKKIGWKGVLIQLPISSFSGSPSLPKGLSRIFRLFEVCRRQLTDGGPQTFLVGLMVPIV